MYKFTMKHDYPKHISYKGYMGAYCNNCYTPVVFDYDISIDSKSEIHGNIMYNTSIDDIKEVVVTCPKCNCEYEAIGIDPNIVDTIALLNKKGYTTLYSCEGNRISFKDINPDSLCNAYISFKDNHMDVLSDNPLPYNWNVDLSLNEFVIRSNIPDGMPVEEYCSEEVLKERMDSIYKWAESLPNNV